MSGLSPKTENLSPPTDVIVAPDSSCRLCLVCASRSDSAHFGVDTCRACAAFFRRSIALKRKYVCRQGTQQCSINARSRFMCRYCRLMKCYACGMHPDNLSKNKCFDSQASLDRGSESPPSGSNVKRESASPADGSTFCSGDLSHLPTLGAIAQQYEIFCQARIRGELSIIDPGRANDPVVDDFQSAEQLIPATHYSLNAIVSQLASFLPDFVEPTFPEYSQLSEHEKRILEPHWISVVYLLESMYRSPALFPGNQNKSLSSYCTYFDLDNIDVFLREIQGEKPREDALRVLTKNIREMKAILRPIMSRGTLTHTEFLAMLGLAMWPQALPLEAQTTSTERLRKLAADVHRRIFRELFQHYRTDMRLQEFSDRICNVNTLLVFLQYGVLRIREDMEIYCLIGLFQATTPIYDYNSK